MPIQNHVHAKLQCKDKIPVAWTCQTRVSRYWSDPILWNAFSSDVSLPAISVGGQVAMVLKHYSKKIDQHASLEQEMESSRRCLSKIQRWGAISRTRLEASKELMVVLPSRGHGAPFKFQGCTMLRIHSCIDQLLSKIQRGITSFSRIREFQNIPGLIIHFNFHIWTLVEIDFKAYSHAARSLLAKFDHY